MKAIGYVRVSTEKQAEDGLSLENQRYRMQRYAEERGIELVGVEHDEGISGKSFDRPGIIRVFKMLEDDEVDAVIIMKIDRFTRNLRDLLTVVDMYFSGKNAKHLISLYENIDTSSAIGRYFLSTIGGIAELERGQISERVQGIVNYKRARGEYLGGLVPYGYAKLGSKLAVVEHEQEVLRRVNLLRNQGLGFQKIARKLTEQGLMRRTGKPFDGTAVRRMLETIKKQKLFQEQE